MTTSARPQVAPSALQRELQDFSRQLKRLVNCMLNRTFDLTVKGSRQRRLMLLILLPVLAFFFSLFIYSLAQWGEQISRLLQYLLVPSFAQANPGAFADFFSFVWYAFFGPQTLRYLPVVILPFILALQAAASYLDDIFELGRVDIAREFILQVALTGSRKHIRIGRGVVAQEHLDSPIHKIGGPGQVEVELDSVALFEKPDGRPHVIGPTIKGKETLEGFERLRQIIDLRDQYPDALQVTSRSLDGIPISAVDVRVVFSIWRKNQPASAEHPHPFDPKAVETLVYSQKSRVTPGERCPSAPPEYWTGPGQSLIRGALSKFMSERLLVEYLASIGMPEVQQARQRESEIREAEDIVLPGEEAPEPRPEPKLPDFQPRHKISNLFSQFAKEFTEKASKRGLELHWVGIGTWQPHKEIVPEKHIEAWRLSSENLARGSQDALEELRQETRLQQIIRQIQDIPLARFQNSINGKHRHRAQDLLNAYRQQLQEAVALLEKSRKPVPQEIRDAIDYIGDAVGHWVH